MKNQKINLIKNNDEIHKIREACRTTSWLHTLMMGQSFTGQNEREVHDLIDSFRLKLGANYEWAFDIILGSGSRTTELHVEASHKVFSQNELIILDAGLKFNGLCADVTRVWPTLNNFSEKQKQIYQIVLDTQSTVISQARPGQTLQGLHEVCKDHLASRLIDLECIENKVEIANYFPHKTSHWIGYNVHEPCPHKYEEGAPIELASGMCFTIEPGLYFNDGKTEFDGIGIRIEDVVVITDNGCEVLSNAPKEVHEIEAIRSLFETSSLKKI